MVQPVNMQRGIVSNVAQQDLAIVVHVSEHVETGLITPDNGPPVQAHQYPVQFEELLVDARKALLLIYLVRIQLRH